MQVKDMEFLESRSLEVMEEPAEEPSPIAPRTHVNHEECETRIVEEFDEIVGMALCDPLQDGIRLHLSAFHPALIGERWACV